jgi:molybdenum cofactor cytidylyltransferase
VGNIAAIVLAAGTASRMGAHKLLLPLGGLPVIARVVAAAEATSAAPVAVVLGHEAGQVRAALARGRWKAIANEEYASGMASSLRAGMEWLEQQPSADTLLGALIVLGDQPLVTASMIERLLERARERPQRICAASYAGERRHPIYFPRTLFGELQVLSGDEGGRSVVAHHGDLLDQVPLEPAEAAMDVDTPGDYARVVTLWRAHFGTATV